MHSLHSSYNNQHVPTCGHLQKYRYSKTNPTNMVQIVHILSRIKHLIPYGSITHLHTEYINWHIGAFVHLYNVYCDSNLSSFAGTCIPQYLSIYEDQDFYKIWLKKCSYLKVEVHGIQINHIRDT